MSRRILADGIWVTAWRMALIIAPIRIVDDLILGHPMSNWLAGGWSLAAGLLGLWITPWLLRWRRGLMVWVRVSKDLMRGPS